MPQIRALTTEARTIPTTALLSAAHNIKTTLVRSVSLVNGQVQVNNVPNIPPFYVGLIQPSGPATPGLPPRQAPPAMLRHASGLTGPAVALGAGYRVSLLSHGLYELLDNGAQITVGSRTIGMVYACQPIDFLYPLSAIISDMDGNPISNMSLAIWNAVEAHALMAGEYEGYEGAAPVEYGSLLMRNVDVMIGTTRYRVIASETEPDSMSVHLRLRKADEPLAS